MIGQLTHGREDRLKKWELDVLLVESMLLGGLGFAGLSSWLRDSVGPTVAQAGGFLLMMLVVFPAIRASARRRGYEFPVPRYIGFALLGTVVGIVVLVMIRAAT